MEEHEPEDAYHFPDRLIRIAWWAKTLSWLVVGIYLLGSIIDVFERLTHSMGDVLTTNRDVALLLFGQVRILLYGAVLFFILQAVSEIIYLLMDIYDRVREKPAGEEAEPDEG